MKTWDIENIIISTVECLLPRCSDANTGLKSTLKFSLTVHTGDDVVYYDRILELVFQRPSNYTKVFSRILDKTGKVIKNWTLKADHDSCWRSDGLKDIFQCYMTIIERAEEECPNHYNRKEKEPSISSSIFHKFIEFVDVEIDKVGDYEYKLKSVSPKK